MTLKRYNKLRRDWKEFKFPRFSDLAKPAQHEIRRSSPERALTVRAAGFLSGIEHRMFRLEPIVRADFGQYLIDEMAKFDEAILEDIRPCDGWLAQV